MASNQCFIHAREDTFDTRERTWSESCATEVSLCHQNSTHLVLSCCSLLGISLAIRPLLKQCAVYSPFCINGFTSLQDNLEEKEGVYSSCIYDIYDVESSHPDKWLLGQCFQTRAS